MKISELFRTREAATFAAEPAENPYLPGHEDCNCADLLFDKDKSAEIKSAVSSGNMSRTSFHRRVMNRIFELMHGPEEGRADAANKLGQMKRKIPVEGNPGQEWERHWLMHFLSSGFNHRDLGFKDSEIGEDYMRGQSVASRMVRTIEESSPRYNRENCGTCNQYLTELQNSARELNDEMQRNNEKLPNDMGRTMAESKSRLTFKRIWDSWTGKQPVKDNDHPIVKRGNKMLKRWNTHTVRDHGVELDFDSHLKHTPISTDPLGKRLEERYRDFEGLAPGWSISTRADIPVQELSRDTIDMLEGAFPFREIYDRYLSPLDTNVTEEQANDMLETMKMRGEAEQYTLEPMKKKLRIIQPPRSGLNRRERQKFEGRTDGELDQCPVRVRRDFQINRLNYHLTEAPDHLKNLYPNGMCTECMKQGCDGWHGLPRHTETILDMRPHEVRRAEGQEVGEDDPEWDNLSEKEKFELQQTTDAHDDYLSPLPKADLRGENGVCENCERPGCDGKECHNIPSVYVRDVQPNPVTITETPRVTVYDRGGNQFYERKTVGNEQTYEPDTTNWMARPLEYDTDRPEIQPTYTNHKPADGNCTKCDKPGCSGWHQDEGFADLQRIPRQDAFLFQRARMRPNLEAFDDYHRSLERYNKQPKSRRLPDVVTQEPRTELVPLKSRVTEFSYPTVEQIGPQYLNPALVLTHDVKKVIPEGARAIPGEERDVTYSYDRVPSIDKDTGKQIIDTVTRPVYEDIPEHELAHQKPSDSQLTAAIRDYTNSHSRALRAAYPGMSRSEALDALAADHAEEIKRYEGQSERFRTSSKKEDIMSKFNSRYEKEANIGPDLIHSLYDVGKAVVGPVVDQVRSVGDVIHDIATQSNGIIGDNFRNQTVIYSPQQLAADAAQRAREHTDFAGTVRGLGEEGLAGIFLNLNKERIKDFARHNFGIGGKHTRPRGQEQEQPIDPNDPEMALRYLEKWDREKKQGSFSSRFAAEKKGTPCEKCGKHCANKVECKSNQDDRRRQQAADSAFND